MDVDIHTLISHVNEHVLASVDATGGLFIPGAVTVIDSSWHFPMPWSVSAASVLAICPVLSSLILQTLARGQIL